MTGADIFLIILLIIGAVQGYREGFLMGVISLLAIILGILGGFALLGQAMLMVEDTIKVDESVLPYVAFFIVFVIIVVVVSLIGKALKATIDKSLLGSLDQAVGAVLGIVKTAFILSVLIWLARSFAADAWLAWAEDSPLFRVIASFAPTLASAVGLAFPSLGDIF